MAIIDTDKDKLDDRLVGPDEPDAVDMEFGALLNRVEKVRLIQLPSEILGDMHEDIVKEQDELKNKLAKLEIQLHRNLVKGNASFYEDARKDCRKFSKMYEDYEDYRKSIYDARQQRIVREGVTGYLGSETYANIIEGTIMVMIVVILSVMSYDMIYLDSVADAGLKMQIFWVDTAFCMVFLSEFFLRYKFAENKRWFVRNNWIDLITSIPIPDGGALRYGRSLRLMRVLRVARLLRVIRIIFFFWKGFDKFTEVMDVKLMKKSFKGVIVVIVIGAYVMMVQEGERDPSIGSFAESMWWSFTTVVTGGFGDIYNPATGSGRALTVLLIITGMILAGVFTATLTTLMTGEENEEFNIMQQNLEERMMNLEKTQKKILQKLDEK
ncbi:MAG TPA: ion transporter [Candidatus Poseidoniia archaeon]|jgi:voltage-gated potassium channel|nr:ion transporter [Candidatus Poseidoniia archaeon]